MILVLIVSILNKFGPDQKQQLASDVISGVAVDAVGLDVCKKRLAILGQTVLSYTTRSLCDGQRTNSN